MFKKKTITLSLAVLYGLLSLLLFSEEFIAELLEVKKNYHLTVTKNFEELNFTVACWEELGDEKEFKFNGDYYDVKKIKRSRNSVTVTVIKDDYENIIKYITKNIFPKNKKGKLLKTKKYLDICCSDSVSETNPLLTEVIQNNFSSSQLHVKSHVKTFFRPPCM